MKLILIEQEKNNPAVRIFLFEITRLNSSTTLNWLKLLASTDFNFRLTGLRLDKLSEP